jgi:HlyD family secretion protein
MERLAAAQLAVAESRLRQTRIFAPASGTVLARLVQPGEAVQGGEPLIEFAQDGETWLLVQPEEKSVLWLEVGQMALASADAYPDSTFQATITKIAPAIDPSRGTVELRLLVPRPPRYLKPDMTVSINVEVGRRESALVLPADAVRDREQHPWVLAVRDGRAARVPVSLGLRGDGLVEIASGLEAGEPIVLPEAARVREGMRVRPQLGPSGTR